MRSRYPLFALAIALFGIGVWYAKAHKQNATCNNNPNTSVTFASLPGMTEGSKDEVREPAAKQPLGKDVFEVAKRYLELKKEVWNLKSYHEFRPVEYRTPLGSHVKFSVYEEGLPLVNVDIEIEVGRDLEVKSAVNRYPDLGKTETDEKTRLSFETVVGKYSSEYTIAKSKQSDAPILFVGPASIQPEYAYVISAVKNGKSVQLVVRAADGQILAQNQSRSEF